MELAIQMFVKSQHGPRALASKMIGAGDPLGLDGNCFGSINHEEVHDDGRGFNDFLRLLYTCPEATAAANCATTTTMMLMIHVINFQGVLHLGSLRPSFGSRIQEREEETCICAPVVIGKTNYIVLHIELYKYYTPIVYLRWKKWTHGVEADVT